MIEEQVLERDGMLDKKLLAKLTIYHRPGDDAHIGELYLDHDYVEDQSKGATCRFGPQSSSVGQKKWPCSAYCSSAEYFISPLLSFFMTSITSQNTRILTVKLHVLWTSQVC